MLININIFSSYAIVVNIVNNKAFIICYKNAAILLRVKAKLNYIISCLIYSKNSLIIPIYSQTRILVKVAKDVPID